MGVFIYSDRTSQWPSEWLRRLLKAQIAGFTLPCLRQSPETAWESVLLTSPRWGWWTLPQSYDSSLSKGDWPASLLEERTRHLALSNLELQGNRTVRTQSSSGFHKRTWVSYVNPLEFYTEMEVDVHVLFYRWWPTFGTLIHRHQLSKLWQWHNESPALLIKETCTRTIIRSAFRWHTMWGFLRVGCYA